MPKRSRKLDVSLCACKKNSIYRIQYCPWFRHLLGVSERMRGTTVLPFMYQDSEVGT